MAPSGLRHEVFPETIIDEPRDTQALVPYSDAVVPKTQPIGDADLSHEIQVVPETQHSEELSSGHREETPLSPTSRATIQKLGISSPRPVAETAPSAMATKLLSRPISSGEDVSSTFQFGAANRSAANVKGAQVSPAPAKQSVVASLITACVPGNLPLDRPHVEPPSQTSKPASSSQKATNTSSAPLAQRSQSIIATKQNDSASAAPIKPSELQKGKEDDAPQPDHMRLSTNKRKAPASKRGFTAMQPTQRGSHLSNSAVETPIDQPLHTPVVLLSTFSQLAQPTPCFNPFPSVIDQNRADQLTLQRTAKLATPRQCTKKDDNPARRKKKLTQGLAQPDLAQARTQPNLATPLPPVGGDILNKSMANPTQSADQDLAQVKSTLAGRQTGLAHTSYFSGMGISARPMQGFMTDCNYAHLGHHPGHSDNSSYSGIMPNFGKPSPMQPFAAGASYAQAGSQRDILFGSKEDEERRKIEMRHRDIQMRYAADLLNQIKESIAANSGYQTNVPESSADTRDILNLFPDSNHACSGTSKTSAKVDYGPSGPSVTSGTPLPSLQYAHVTDALHSISAIKRPNRRLKNVDAPTPPEAINDTELNMGSLPEPSSNNQENDPLVENEVIGAARMLMDISSSSPSTPKRTADVHNGQPQSGYQGAATTVDERLGRASSPHSPSRITKRPRLQQEPSIVASLVETRPQSSFVPDIPHQYVLGNSPVDVALQTLEHSMQLERSTRARQASEEGNRAKRMIAEIRTLKSSERNLLAELQSTQQENVRLSTEHDRLRRQIDGYKKFCEGTGRDVDRAQAQLNEFRNSGREIQDRAYAALHKEREDNARIRGETTALYNTAIAAATRARDESMTLLRETKGKLDLQQLRNIHLSGMLGGKAAEIATERVRSASLEKQLVATRTNLVENNEAKERAEKNAEILLGLQNEISSIQRNLANSESTSKLQSILEKCTELVQSARTQEGITPVEMDRAVSRICDIVGNTNTQLQGVCRGIDGNKTSNESVERLIEAQISALRKDVLQHQASNQELAAAHDSIVALTESSSARDQEVSKLQQELGEAMKRESTLRGEVSRLESELLDLQAVPAEDPTLPARLDEAQKDNVLLRTELDDIKAELASSSEQLHSIPILKQQLEEARLQIKQAESEKKTTQIEHDAELREVRIQSNKDAIRVQLEQQAEFENHLHLADKQNLDLKMSLEVNAGELSSSARKILDFEATIRSKDREINTLRQDIETQRKASESVREELVDNFSKEIDGLRKQLQSKTDSSNNLFAEVSKLNANQSAMQRKLGALQTALDSANDVVAGHQTGINDLRDSNDTTRAKEREQHGKELRHACDRNTDLGRTVLELQQDLDSSRKESKMKFEEHRKEVNEVQQRAITAETRVQSLNNELRVYLDQESQKHQKEPEASQNVDTGAATAKHNKIMNLRTRNQQNNSSFGEYTTLGGDDASVGDDILGALEMLDENGVSVVEPEWTLPARARNPRPSLSNHQLPMSFSRFNRCLERDTTPLPKRSSSLLSDAATLDTPEGFCHQGKLTVDRLLGSTPSKSVVEPTPGRQGLSGIVVQLSAPPESLLPSLVNPFFDSFDRPKSQANIASRMAPTSQSQYRAAEIVASQAPSQADQSRETSSPDYVHKDPSSSHRVATYSHTTSRPASGTDNCSELDPTGSKAANQHSTKRRGSLAQEGGDLKRHRDEHAPADEHSRYRVTRSSNAQALSGGALLKSSHSQAPAAKLSQSQAQNLSSIPTRPQSVAGLAIQSRKRSARGNSKPKSSKNQAYNDRFSKELGKK